MSKRGNVCPPRKFNQPPPTGQMHSYAAAYSRYVNRNPISRSVSTCNGRDSIANQSSIGSDERLGFNRKQAGTTRRVRFKPANAIQGRNGPGKGPGINIKIARTMIAERLRRGGNNEGSNINNRKNTRNYQQKFKGSPTAWQTGGHKKFLDASSDWFLVIIKYGQKYEKDVIIRLLLSEISPVEFNPLYWEVKTDNVQFFVDDIEIARTIWNLDRKIQMDDGFKMQIIVRSNTPFVQLDGIVKERMKNAMIQRYTEATKALDLTKFHADPHLTDVFCGLSRPTIMLAVIDIITANIPNLEALSLDNNKIHTMEPFKDIESKMPCLKALHLKNNKITSLACLDALKKLPLLAELSLDGNPISDHYEYEIDFVSDVGKLLPKLVTLDGTKLEKQIGFDIDDETSLPPAKASFLCDVASTDIVRQFIEQYFIIFDSNNRQPLLDAYHENAMISVSVASAQKYGQRLASFWLFNRNFLRHRDLEIRFRQLRTGRLPVVNFLSGLPLTQHDPQSFAVDFNLCSAHLMSFTVTGIFKELPSASSEIRTPQLRSFQRIFMIVPSGDGFCICNEMVHITHITRPQLTTAFQTTEDVKMKDDVSATVPNTVFDEETQLQMIQSLSTQTTMNFEWSKKCLEETNFDYNRAASVFTDLQQHNNIPAEAFLK